MAEPGAQLVAVGLGLDHGPRDQVGVVDRALVAEHVEVLPEEVAGGLELGHPLTPAEPDQVVGVEAPLAGAGQHRVHLAGEPAGARPRPAAASGQRTDSGWSVSSSVSTTSCSGALSSRSGAAYSSEGA